MNLQEAVNTGKKFMRLGDSEFLSFEEFREFMTHDDLVAIDYVIEPESSVTLTVADFKETWDSVAAVSNSVKPSHSSPLYAKLVAALFE